MTVELSRSLRADAADNRDRIVAAAYRLFAAEGMTVTMREIARQAGVGPATLYRHFPTKQDLAVEAFAEQVRICRQVVDDGLAEPDGIPGRTAQQRRTASRRFAALTIEAFRARF
ncbi:hypothetical protein GCM10009745_19340 [Kribbella yunnanensis]|uniref:HTH tetR-type domain-containing protein n=1 Tax=Kribbella yunnanensis TaxID=190194 RepID=A0ABP4SR86_9ACTN